MLDDAILAGGLATRLRSLMKTIPKSLAEIEGEPFQWHQLRLLRSRGMQRVVLCLGRMGELVQKAVGDGQSFGLAVNDFRKITGMQAYAPTDNVAELTARTNDDGWATIFESWLRVSRLTHHDALLVFSVGVGNLDKNVSPNLVAALQYAKGVGAKITGIVGRDGGFTAKAADICVVVPTVNSVHTTPHAEAFQTVVWHLIVSHPKLKEAQTKWESVKP